MIRTSSLLVLLCLNLSAFAQEATLDESATEQIHEQLRVMRDRMFEAYEQRDVDALLKDVEDNVVITWQNGDRNLNHAEFRRFYDSMLSGDNRTVREMSSDFAVDGMSLIYGDDTAVAYGTCTDHFVLNDGRDFKLTSKWTATVVKNDENWKVACFHISASIFDNPILTISKSWIMKAGIIGGISGLILGCLLMFFVRKRPLVTGTRSEDNSTSD